MAKSLDFYQVFYKDDHIPELYLFAIPHDNRDKVTEYFENSVIVDLVPQSKADLISVCSWKLRRKREGGQSEIILRREGKFDLTMENIVNYEYDIAILTPRSPAHNIMVMAYNWHRAAMVDAIKELQKFIKVPEEMIGNAIYENHFIAKREIYHEYVDTCLKPCIEFMRGKEVFEKDANYNSKKRAHEVKEYQETTGRQYWPIAPFVLERLFRIWINDKPLRIISL